MPHRVFNFSAGPSVLPLSVLQQAASELTCYQDTGVSILELGHRTKTFQAVTAQATDRVRQILDVPEDYDVFFVQGGGRLIFSVLAMNFCQDGRKGHYLVSGSWGKAALAEAQRSDQGFCVWNGADSGYSTLPTTDALHWDSSPPAYLHYTSNETIEGVQFPEDLRPQLSVDVPIICDVSSDFMSRRIDVRNYDMLYACIQKNLGPAGATLVIAKKAFLQQAPVQLPSYLRLANHAEAESMLNTPPVFCIYIANLVLEWFISTFGSLEKVEAFNQQKSNLVYQALEAHPQFYQCHADPRYRSRMNHTFRLPDEATEREFLKQAEANQLAYLAGHRSVGGMRASLYNAMPMEGAVALAEFIQQFPTIR